MTHASSVHVFVLERVGGAGDRGTQVGAGERGGAADVARPQLRNLLQPGRQVQNALEGQGLCGTVSSVLTGLKLVPEHQHMNLRRSDPTATFREEIPVLPRRTDSVRSSGTQPLKFNKGANTADSHLSSIHPVT